VVKKDNIILFI